MSIDVAIGAASAVIAAMSALWAIWSSRLARRDSLEARESARQAHAEAENIARESNSLQALDWTSQYFEGVRAWGDEVTYAISKAIHLGEIHDSAERERERVNVRSRLSSCIDTGRWYFPNEYQEEFGREKPIAYRGVRRKVLDHLVDAYNAVELRTDHRFTEQPSDDGQVVGELERAKREFVSVIQQVLNPHQREKQVESIVRHFDVSERMRLPSDTDQP